MPPTNEQFEVNSVWATNTPQGQTENITVPSGQTCRAKRLGMEGLMAAGILGEADSLTEYVGRKHMKQIRGANGTPDGEELNLKSIMGDPKALQALVMMTDRAMPLIVMEPPVLLHFTEDAKGVTTRIPEDQREAGKVYTDQLGLEDKMFLYQYAVGGTRDIERFRSESKTAVGDVADGANVSRPAKRPARGKGRTTR